MGELCDKPQCVRAPVCNILRSAHRTIIIDQIRFKIITGDCDRVSGCEYGDRVTGCGSRLTVVGDADCDRADSELQQICCGACASRGRPMAGDMPL